MVEGYTVTSTLTIWMVCDKIHVNNVYGVSIKGNVSLDMNVICTPD